jgi:DNA modification methylase
MGAGAGGGMTATILQGDVLAVLRTLPSDHFGCVITSPPYWGLRDYGVDGQLGLEATLGEHLAKMVEVFEEVRRVLHPKGTCWVNYGDCYATTPNGRSAKDTKTAGKDDRTFRDKPFTTIQGGMKPKDLCMVPNRFAIALQDAGWWVRSECILAKPNPMPESISDRPATAHEKVFLFTKSGRYHYDDEVVKQPVSTNTHARISQDLANQVGSYRANGGKKTNGPMKAVVSGSSRKFAPENQSMIGQKASRDTALALKVDKRNLRNWEPAPLSVCTIPIKGFRESHFATFPPELVERCIRAGAPPGLPILDPFGGSGTTALVANAFGYDTTLIELNPEYIALARRRLAAGLVKMDRPATPAAPKAAKDDRQGVML